MKVRIEEADLLRHDVKIGKQTQSLVGNVKLSHVNTLLHCDSAYMYNDSNRVRAFGNVHIIQNDSIHIYGDYLEYEGNENLAKIRRNVRANKGNTWLYTEFLDYNRATDIGYYYQGGKVENGNSVLISDKGYYYTTSNEVYFKDSVVVTTPDYTMFGDTMKYHTQTEIVHILGPTFIVSDQNLIYSEDGWYNTQIDESMLLKNSYIQGKENLLKGDTVYYNRKNGMGEVFSRMELHDTINHIVIKGDYGYYNEQTKYAMATRKAEMWQIYGHDTLFMHADTFKVDPLPEIDSRIVRAYRKVKFFRFDMQGRCDSLVYDFRDSTSTMFYKPVVWAQGNQMSAQTIQLFTRNQAVYKVDLNQAAFIVSPETDSVFNQIKGKTMVGHIRANELYKIDVDGNGQTIYYPKDGEQSIGINRAESSNMTIFMRERKVSNIVMRVSPEGNMNPLFVLPQQETVLKGFRWLDPYRPQQRDDIFKELPIPEELEDLEVYEGYSFDEIQN